MVLLRGLGAAVMVVLKRERERERESIVGEGVDVCVVLRPQGRFYAIYSKKKF